MKLAPQVGITVSIGPDFRPVAVDWSISLTGADDTPSGVVLHKAESAGVDFVKQEMQPEIDAVISALKEKFVI
jgi:hypothetical protein